MATSSDQIVGAGMMAAGILIFLYYTLWVVILPFVDSSHVINSYFPPRMYAILLPVVAGVLGLLVVGSFISIVLLKSKKSAKKTN